MLFKLKFKVLNTLAIAASYIFGDRMPPTPSVSAIIERNDKLLVIKLSYKAGVALPGGFLKANEDFETAIKREILEETRLKVISLKYFGTYFTTEPYAKVNVTYMAEVKGTMKASKEGEPVWMEAKEVLRKLVYKDNIKAVKDFLRK